jgi:Zn finger protein HypA/HybF involved in hydrogenase expression
MSNKKNIDYTFIIIPQKAIPLKCLKCERPWYYKPQNEEQIAKVTTCPKCRSMVTIKKAMIIGSSNAQAAIAYNQAPNRNLKAYE